MFVYREPLCQGFDATLQDWPPQPWNAALLCWQEITSESTKCWRPWGEILVGWQGTACETAVWWTEKGKMGGEKRGMRTEAPGIRQSPLTKHCLPRTHISFPTLSSRGGGVQKQQPCLPPPPSHECQASDQGDSANSCLRLLGLGHKHSTHRSPGETEWEGDP